MLVKSLACVLLTVMAADDSTGVLNEKKVQSATSSAGRYKAAHEAYEASVKKASTLFDSLKSAVSNLRSQTKSMAEKESKALSMFQKETKLENESLEGKAKEFNAKLDQVLKKTSSFIQTDDQTAAESKLASIIDGSELKAWRDKLERVLSQLPSGPVEKEEGNIAAFIQLHSSSDKKEGSFDLGKEHDALVETEKKWKQADARLLADFSTLSVERDEDEISEKQNKGLQLIEEKILKLSQKLKNDYQRDEKDSQESILSI